MAQNVSVANVNRDDSRWNANVNRLDNDNRWNADNRLLVRNSSHFLPLAAGVFLSTYVFHPTSILLASTKSPAIRIYCAFVIASLSQPMSRKNFAASSFSIEYSSASSFRLPEAYPARNACSSVSRNAVSMRAATVCRLVLATCGSAACQARYASFSLNTTGTSFSCEIVGGRGTFRGMGGISVSHSYDDIISVDNLLDAWKEFLRGKQKKRDVQAFEYNLIKNISTLRADLSSGAYRHGSYSHFKISDPKPRDIHKARVRDRLLHHAIYRVLYPHFNRTFINDSYSCRLNKGTHRAMAALRRYAYQASKNHTKTLWVLKCDIRKFFASVDHKILLAVLRRHLSDERTLALLENVIESFHSTAPGKGLPLGNLTSQLLVNVYMNEFDQFAKHRLKARHYVRYADDFVVLSTDRAWIESLLLRIRAFLHDHLKLDLHPSKVSITTFASGIDFLGWVHFPDHRVLRTSTKRRMLKALQGNPEEATRASYRGLLSHGNAYTLAALVPKPKSEASRLLFPSE
ncbi:MAG: reverse transcriptase domain-containing protein [Minisyncoccota bacterium]